MQVHHQLVWVTECQTTTQGEAGHDFPSLVAKIDSFSHCQNLVLGDSQGQPATRAPTSTNKPPQWEKTLNQDQDILTAHPGREADCLL